VATTNVETRTPAPQDDVIPKYSASGQPVTRGYRIAFQVWVLCVLLTLVVTLALYLFDKLYEAF
jgi:hypothetical protein